MTLISIEKSIRTSYCYTNGSQAVQNLLLNVNNTKGLNSHHQINVDFVKSKLEDKIVDNIKENTFFSCTYSSLQKQLF